MNQDQLIKSLNRLKKTDVKKKIDLRLRQFSVLNKRCSRSWFSELCFCILTANSRAKTAIAIQKELGKDGFLNADLNKLRRTILNNKHRFYNNKARFIIEARKFKEVKKIVKEFENSRDGREWIAKNVKGVGFKEASHFLRNVGYFDLAVLDRHILRLLHENAYIHEIPKTLSEKKYLEIEIVFSSLAKRMKMSCAELDLYMWYMKTGKVLK